MNSAILIIAGVASINATAVFDEDGGVESSVTCGGGCGGGATAIGAGGGGATAIGADGGGATAIGAGVGAARVMVPR